MKSLFYRLIGMVSFFVLLARAGFAVDFFPCAEAFSTSLTVEASSKGSSGVSQEEDTSSGLDVSWTSAMESGRVAYMEHVGVYEGHDGRFHPELLSNIDSKFLNQKFKIGGESFSYGDLFDKEINVVLVPDALERAEAQWGRFSYITQMVRDIQKFKLQYRVGRVSSLYVWRENGEERARMGVHFNEGRYTEAEGDIKEYPGLRFLLDERTGIFDFFRVTYVGPFVERVPTYRFSMRELFASQP